MAVVFPDLGELALLNRMLAADEVSDWSFVLHLYTNAVAVNRVSVLDDFVAATFAGYAPVEILPADWLPAATQLDGRAVSHYGGDPIAFVCVAGTQDIRGWLLTDADVTVCVAAEAFSTIRTVTVTVPIVLNPFITLASVFAPNPP